MSYTIDILYYRISMVTHSLGTHGLSCHPRHASMDSSKKKSIYQQTAQLVPMGRYATQMASLRSGRMLLWDVTCPN